MIRHLLRSIFPYAAAVSLVLVLVLWCGYFGRFGITLVILNPPAPLSRCYSIYLEEGRVAFWRDLRVTNVINTPISKWRIGWQGRTGTPDRKRSLWEFDAHPVSFGGLRSAPPAAYLIAFPIWCLLLPSLILPILWWRKRKRPDYVGFAVIQTDRR
jgi:hypothetical protein